MSMSHRKHSKHSSRNTQSNSYMLESKNLYIWVLSSHSYHESPGYIAAQSPGPQQEALCGDHLVQVQGRNQPPSHQLQVQVHWGLCKPGESQGRHLFTKWWVSILLHLSHIFFFFLELLPFRVHAFAEVDHPWTHGPLWVLLPTYALGTRCENRTLIKLIRHNVTYYTVRVVETVLNKRKTLIAHITKLLKCLFSFSSFD